VAAIAPHPPRAQDALGAYEALAPFYDELTAGYAHEAWLQALERELRCLGLSGRRVLDVACGTGKSSLPLVELGYEVSACDVSPTMVQMARERLGLPDEQVFVADMRRLPVLPPFDAVTCLDDAVNYLLTEGDVRATFAGIGRALRPGGLLAFDLNSLRTYGSAFVTRSEVEAESATFVWEGEPRQAIVPGGMYRATVEVMPRGNGSGTVTSVNTQRHYPRETVERLLRAAGLRPVTVFGQAPGGRLLPAPDEHEHTKLLYVAERKERKW
jgi:cyclopropane fatty-acyl-phospholipid synthase-like methyltransferase